MNYKLQISRCKIMFDPTLETHQLVHPHNTLCYHTSFALFLLAAADRLRWEILAASWAPSAAPERRTAKASAEIPHRCQSPIDATEFQKSGRKSPREGSTKLETCPSFLANLKPQNASRSSKSPTSTEKIFHNIRHVRLVHNEPITDDFTCPLSKAQFPRPPAF